MSTIKSPSLRRILVAIAGRVRDAVPLDVERGRKQL
jgi:hypothetical protein